MSFFSSFIIGPIDKSGVKSMVFSYLLLAVSSLAPPDWLDCTENRRIKRSHGGTTYIDYNLFCSRELMN
jgi:hypothetical protein